MLSDLHHTEQVEILAEQLTKERKMIKLSSRFLKKKQKD